MAQELPGKTEWHALPVAEVLRILQGRSDGLSAEETERRLAIHGRNQLPPPKKRSACLRFLSQFNNALVLVLLAAAGVTLLLGHFMDCVVIVGVTVLNALIGFIQEGRAEAALDAIRDMLTPSASVVRDGVRSQIEATELVPGDVVLLAEGDRVPADLRLLEARELRIEESALTGEALPVEKTVAPAPASSVPGDRLCMAFSSTLVVHGQGRGLVVATGANTEIGQISTMLSSVEAVSTPLLRKMAEFGRVLTIAISAFAVLAFLCGVWLGNYGWREMFMVAVGVAVAAIPEGLPAIVTITLAIGVRRMAARNAIVRRLPAVETLGSVTVICTDKTGTLTRNEMSVQRVSTSEHIFEVGGTGYGPEGGIHLDGQPIDPREYVVLGELALAGLLCNDALVNEGEAGWHLQGDPTEGSLCTLAMKAGLEARLEGERAPRLDVIPFAAEHRFMATLHDAAIYLKGAPEAVLARCSQQRALAGDEPIDLAYWEAQNDSLARQGLRVLALATIPAGADQRCLQQDTLGAGFILLGLVGISDPPREEARRSIDQCHAAGIRVKMITGDHAITARAIGRQLGLGAPDYQTLTGEQIERMSDEDLREAAEHIDIFARASPAHKLRLVEALQARGAVVAMTGDGVNDAPALKRASVGVAMGQKGAEVAKEAAEMVLTDDNFATISHAVEEGRTVYENIRKSILYILPTSIGEAGAILVAMAMGLEMPITPVQILWVNMVTTVSLSLSLAFLPATDKVMSIAPRSPDEPLLSKFLAWRILFVTVLMSAAALILFDWSIRMGSSLEVARSVAVNMVVVGDIAYLFNCRDLQRSILSWEGVFGNRSAWIATFIVMGLQMAFTSLPWMQAWFGTADLSWQAWIWIAAFGVLIFLVVEAEKACLRKFARP